MDRRWEQKRTEGFVIVFIYYTLPFPRCGIGYNGFLFRIRTRATTLVRIGYNGFLFPHSYPGDDLGAY